MKGLMKQPSTKTWKDRFQLFYKKLRVGAIIERFLNLFDFEFSEFLKSFLKAL